jgi:hypothetical protein
MNGKRSCVEPYIKIYDRYISVVRSCIITIVITTHVHERNTSHVSVNTHMYHCNSNKKTCT